MDTLNFDKENVIVLEGSSLMDAPLAKILAEHHMTEASLTSVVQEKDLTIKPKVVV
jgi:ADP-glucose pyrophosphorylase